MTNEPNAQSGAPMQAAQTIETHLTQQVCVIALLRALLATHPHQQQVRTQYDFLLAQMQARSALNGGLSPDQKQAFQQFEATVFQPPAKL